MLSIIAFVLYCIAAVALIVMIARAGLHKAKGGEAVAGMAQHFELPPLAMQSIGFAELAACVGLVVGALSRPLGILTTACLVLLFAGAVMMHIRAKDDANSRGPALVIMCIAVAALVFRLLSHFSILF